MKKFLIYILILIVIIGIFSPTSAIAQRIPGVCRSAGSGNVGGELVGVQKEDCTFIKQWKVVYWDEEAVSKQPTGIEKMIKETCDEDSWGIFPCLLRIAYSIFYQLPALLLWVSALFFNALVAIGLDTKIYSQNFLSESWGVVRDLSNVFFIIILLYVAIEMILGMGHGGKKTIAQVIIMALLINFSMFATRIVIDSSNILALIFYNKLNVETFVKEDNVVSRADNYTAVTSNPIERDISGGLVQAFDPTRMLNDKFFEQAQQTYVHSLQVVAVDSVPTSVLLGIIVVAGLLMGYAAYVFFVSGFAFLSRLIELFILTIFSPFAFMSSTLPILSGVPYAGWKKWLDRLLEVAFMAPIFMFLLYLIFKLVNSRIFDGFIRQDQGTIGMILGLVIPAIMILTMLNMAAKYAKKASGKLGEVITSAAKVVGGLAIGGAALGGAALLRGTVGATAKAVQNNTVRDKALTFADTRAKWNQPGVKSKFSAARAAVGNIPKWLPAVAATAIHGGRNLNAQGQAQAGGVGKWAQKQDKGFGEKTHATHVLDQKMQQEFGNQYGKDAKYKDLTEREQGIVKKEVDKDEIAKFRYGKLFKDLGTRESGVIMTDYNIGTRILEHEHTGVKSEVVLPTNPATGQVIPPAANTDLKIMSDVIAEHAKANAAIGEFVQALRKGSYDIRNLPDMSAKSKGFSKLTVGLIAGVAAGVRLGLKKGGGIEYGTPQKDIFKDIGNTITEALKNVKINVGGGGGHGKDDHAKEVKSVGH